MHEQRVINQKKMTTSQYVAEEHKYAKFSSFCLNMMLKETIYQKMLPKSTHSQREQQFFVLCIFRQTSWVVQKQKKRQDNNLASLQPRGDEEVVRQLLNDHDQRAVLLIGQ